MDTNRLRRLADRIRKDEDTVRSIQLASLRQKRMLPDVPQVDGFEFAQKYEPAAHVSGDFYDFIKIDTTGTKWGIVVGDVSGHGVEAGIIMGMAKQTVSIYGRQIEDPIEVMRATNEELYRSLDGKTFVSMSYAVLDVENHAIKFVRAGQCRPLLLNARWKNPVPQVVDSKGLALGVDAGPRFSRVLEPIDINLQPGDIFFQYTDGLVEATNKDKEQFSDERVVGLLGRYGRISVKELLEIVAEALTDFTRATEEEDDITMVAVKVRDTQQMTTRTARFDLAQVRAALEKKRLATPDGFAPPVPKTSGAGAGLPAMPPAPGPQPPDGTAAPSTDAGKPGPRAPAGAGLPPPPTPSRRVHAAGPVAPAPSPGSSQAPAGKDDRTDAKADGKADEKNLDKSPGNGDSARKAAPPPLPDFLA